MMTRALFAAALLAATTLSVPSRAEDPRLVERPYNADEVVRIEGRANVQATIRFAEGEHIENVAIGDSTAWQVTPNRRANLLFIKPLADRAATNMTVVTDKRTYLFDLVASPANRNPLYVLSFAYPDEPEEAQVAGAAPDGPNAVELAAASDPYAVVDPAELNYAWESKGDRTLIPTEVYDDGAATFLTWAPGATLPAILVKNAEGTEGPVNYAVRGEVIVVDGVPREIVLRAGRGSATLSNRGPVRAASRPALAQADGNSTPNSVPNATEVK
jgi:type IV secretion system protein VirB9